MSPISLAIARVFSSRSAQTILFWVRKRCTLERRGWTGLLVEPLAEKAALLRVQRKAEVAEVACGAPIHHNTMLDLKVAGRDGIASTLAESFVSLGDFAEEIRRVRVVTLDSLLEEAGFDNIDFLSIDVEGFESEVLKGLSLESIRPSLILIEDRLFNLTSHQHLIRAGYKLVRRTGINSWYVPQMTDWPISLFGHIQLYRKFHWTSVLVRAAKRSWRRRRSSEHR